MEKKNVIITLFKNKRGYLVAQIIEVDEPYHEIMGMSD